MLRVLFVAFAAFCVHQCNGLLGGEGKMSESEFRSLPGFESEINDVLLSSNSNEDLQFFKYACGTKKVVSGYLVHVEYLACKLSSEKTCLSEPVECSAQTWIQMWLIQGAPYHGTTVKCATQDPSITKNWGNCTESHRPKRDLSNNLLHQPMEMHKPHHYDEDVKPIFDRFIEMYNKGYSEDANNDEYQRRYEIFKKNMKIVETLNEMDQGTAVYGITEFMDYSSEEYKRYLAPGFTKQLVDIQQADLTGLHTNNMPESVDWRKMGAVTGVKNQGQCGSCWAFSTTGNIEGQWFIKKKKLVSLSEQELVDCDSLDQGCGGGLPSNAYKSIEKLGGLETESDYPYEGRNDKCDIKRSDLRVYINDSVALPTDEGKLAAWLASNGPISIGINANMMQFYFGGISHPWKIFCNPSSLDHGVLIVGYGTENGTPFWIIKNSWGANWGESGYYRIYRGDGSCGVNRMATSSIVN